MSDRTITEDEVRDEHLAEVDQRAHWLYMLAVIGLGGVAMLILLAILDAT